jgi:triosephosphate isomerase
MKIKKILIFNWKANPNSLGEAANLSGLINQYFPKLNINYEVAVAVPSLYLMPLLQMADKNIKLITQSVNVSENGPHTGALTPLMFKENGISYSLLGHSEDKKRNKLTNAEIALLLEANLKNSVKTILCVGEETKGDESFEEIQAQIDQIFLPLIKKYSVLEINNNIALAYEPLWAIGSQMNLDLEYIVKRMSAIKNYLNSKFENNVYCLYGGSVDKANIKELLAIPDLFGVLVGERSSQKEWLEELLQSVV